MLLLFFSLELMQFKIKKKIRKIREFLISDFLFNCAKKINKQTD